MIESFEWGMKHSVDQLLWVKEEYENDSSEYSKEELLEYADDAVDQYCVSVDQLEQFLV